MEVLALYLYKWSRICLATRGYWGCARRSPLVSSSRLGRIRALVVSDYSGRLWLSDPGCTILSGPQFCGAPPHNSVRPRRTITPHTDAIQKTGYFHVPISQLLLETLLSNILLLTSIPHHIASFRDLRPMHASFPFTLSPDPTARFTSAVIQVSLISMQCRSNVPSSGQSQTGESAVFCLENSSTSSLPELISFV